VVKRKLGKPAHYIARKGFQLPWIPHEEREKAETHLEKVSTKERSYRRGRKRRPRSVGLAEMVPNNNAGRNPSPQTPYKEEAREKYTHHHGSKGLEHLIKDMTLGGRVIGGEKIVLQSIDSWLRGNMGGAVGEAGDDAIQGGRDNELVKAVCSWV